MAKVDYINTIKSYLGDGFIMLPAGAREDLRFNDVSLEEFRNWIQLAQSNLEALSESGKLSLIPESILSNLVSNLNEIRSAVQQFVVPDQNAVNAFTNCVNQMEQLIYQTTSYLPLADKTSYQTLATQVKALLEELENSQKENARQIESQNARVKVLNTKSANILRKVSSGVLSKNFEALSNSKWNIVLMVASGTIAVFAFIVLCLKSNELTRYLIEALQSNDLDYKIFVAKWLTSLPYILMLTVGILELRSRIKLRDLFVFRQSVASSLEGYTESLLNKVEDIASTAEKSKARRIVIEFMIESMLELSKPPSIRGDKTSLGIKFKDVGEANLSSD